MQKSFFKDCSSDWPIRAYNNLAFLNSPSARTIRILAEMIEPSVRFRRYQVQNTVVFFGSTSALPRQEAQKNLKAIEAKFHKKPAIFRAEYERAKAAMKMSHYYEDAVFLSEKLTTWFRQFKSPKERFFICTGGGPGIMEAANKGAKKAGGKSIGLNISLPKEQNPNCYQTKELAFEFHYFFIRKFWFFYLAKALVVFPGGFGTFDEFFELLTLIQTHKTKKYMPVVLYGKEYWEQVVNFKHMAEWGTISQNDLKLFSIFDTVEGAFRFLTSELEKRYL